MSDKNLGSLVAAACLVYTLAAASEYWLLNWLSYDYDIVLPILATIVQTLSWPIQLLVYFYAKNIYDSKNSTPRVITAEMYKNYAILGCLNSIISLSRMVGLTSLPPTIYVIVANTEIVFEVIMTKVILGRVVSYYQILSVCMVVLGIAFALYDPSSQTYGSNPNVSRDELMIGLCVSLLSRFCSSLNTVLADRFLGADRKTELGVLECSFFNAFVPFLLVPLSLLMVPEYKHWGEVYDRRSSHAKTYITLLFICIALAKYFDRISKFYIVARATTIFYAVLDANMKIVAGVGAFLFFGEATYWPQICGYVLIFFALLITVYEKLSLVSSSPHKEVRFSSVDNGNRLSFHSIGSYRLNSEAASDQSYALISDNDKDLGNTPHIDVYAT